MQYAIYMFKNVRETQKVGGLFSHKGTKAFDEGGKDTGIDNYYAPCDLKVVAKGGSQVNFVYFQSIAPVKFANGQEDYINFRVGHDNDISNIYVGQVFKQFDVIGQEGTRGANGNHSHIQVAKGQYKGILKGIYGFYMLVNEIHPTEVFSMLEGYNSVLKTSYTWNWVKNSAYVALIAVKNENVYIIKRGDTLSSIAKRYKTTYQKIAKDNGISNPNRISVGQKLIIK